MLRTAAVAGRSRLVEIISAAAEVPLVPAKVSFVPAEVIFAAAKTPLVPAKVIFTAAKTPLVPAKIISAAAEVPSAGPITGIVRIAVAPASVARAAVPQDISGFPARAGAPSDAITVQFGADGSGLNVTSTDLRLAA